MIIQISFAQIFIIWNTYKIIKYQRFKSENSGIYLIPVERKPIFFFFGNFRKNYFTLLILINLNDSTHEF